MKKIILIIMIIMTLTSCQKSLSLELTPTPENRNVEDDLQNDSLLMKQISGAFADVEISKQVVYESKEARITLVGAQTYEDTLRLDFIFENLSNVDRAIGIVGASINKCMHYLYKQEDMAPMEQKEVMALIYIGDFDVYGIVQATDIQIGVNDMNGGILPEDNITTAVIQTSHTGQNDSYENNFKNPLLLSDDIGFYFYDTEHKYDYDCVRYLIENKTSEIFFTNGWATAINGISQWQDFGDVVFPNCINLLYINIPHYDSSLNGDSNHEIYSISTALFTKKKRMELDMVYHGCFTYNIDESKENLDAINMGLVVYDDMGLTVGLTQNFNGFYEDEYYALRVKNTTDEAYYISFSSKEINGESGEAYARIRVLPKTCAIEPIFLEYDGEVDTIEIITFDMNVKDHLLNSIFSTEITFDMTDLDTNLIN